VTLVLDILCSVFLFRITGGPGRMVHPRSTTWPLPGKNSFENTLFEIQIHLCPWLAEASFPKIPITPRLGLTNTPALFLGTTASQPKALGSFTHRFCRRKRSLAAIACGNKNSPEVSPGCFRELLPQRKGPATKIGSVLNTSTQSRSFASVRSCSGSGRLKV